MDPKVKRSRGWQLLTKLLEVKTQVELAAELDVKQATISQLARLQALPSRRVSLRLEAVGIPGSSWDQPPTNDEGQASEGAA